MGALNLKSLNGGTALADIDDSGNLTLAGGATIGGAVAATGALSGTNVTATGNATLGNAAADVHAITGKLTHTGLAYAGSVQSINMADAAHALITTGTAGAGQTLITSSVLAVDPNSTGAGEDLTLPAAASNSGLQLWITNSGSENVVLKDGVSTLATLAGGAGAHIISNGSGWGLFT